MWLDASYLLTIVIDDNVVKRAYPAFKGNTTIKTSKPISEGSQAGLPMSELSIVDPPKPTPAAQTQSQPPLNPFFNPAEAEKPKPGMAKEQTTLDEGAVVIECPKELSAESVEDLAYWLKGFLNKARRRAGIDPPTNDAALAGHDRALAMVRDSL